MLKVGQTNEPDKWKCDENTLPTVALMRENAHFFTQATVLFFKLNGGQVTVISNTVIE